MNHILIAVIIGVIAGTIDVIPMIIQKLDKRACMSAFVHWVFLGIIIPFVEWDIQPWLKGLIIGELAVIPVIILISGSDKKAILPILAFSAILGMGVAIAGAKFIG